ncbi:hypothetical protein HMPREF0490_01244 [Lachnospiraceae bacterium 6_1_37FAA]|jgi:hypothetical protein|nr:hypothetical protein HMPREF0490_01244 [Lachnospiraceae bacterium 6_1_37FAA]
MWKITEREVLCWKLLITEASENYLGVAENSPVIPLSSRKWFWQKPVQSGWNRE